MNKIEIRSPIWGQKAIGIHPRKVVRGLNQIDIIYKESSGFRLYPKSYIAEDTFIKSFRKQGFQTKVGMIKLIVIPIRDLEELDDRT